MHLCANQTTQFGAADMPTFRTASVIMNYDAPKDVSASFVLDECLRSNRKWLEVIDECAAKRNSSESESRRLREDLAACRLATAEKDEEILNMDEHLLMFSSAFKAFSAEATTLWQRLKYEEQSRVALNRSFEALDNEATKLRRTVASEREDNAALKRQVADLQRIKDEEEGQAAKIKNDSRRHFLIFLAASSFAWLCVLLLTVWATKRCGRAADKQDDGPTGDDGNDMAANHTPPPTEDTPRPTREGITGAPVDDCDGAVRPSSYQFCNFFAD